MKTFIISLAILTLTAQSLRAQTTGSAAADSSNNQYNSWYAEFGGQSLVGVTFNYERFLSKKPGGFSVHIGAGGGYLPDLFDDGIVLFGAFPAGISYNIPVTENKRQFIEVGASYSFLLVPSDVNANLTSLNVSYRYQSPSGKFQLRATLTPLMYSIGDNTAVPWLGFSLGRRF